MLLDFGLSNAPDLWNITLSLEFHGFVNYYYSFTFTFVFIKVLLEVVLHMPSTYTHQRYTQRDLSMAASFICN